MTSYASAQRPCRDAAATGATIRRLAKLAPRTLAVMHGSSYAGDTAPVLESLAGFYGDLLQERAAPGRG